MKFRSKKEYTALVVSDSWCEFGPPIGYDIHGAKLRSGSEKAYVDVPNTTDDSGDWLLQVGDVLLVGDDGYLIRTFEDFKTEFEEVG